MTERPPLPPSREQLTGRLTAALTIGAPSRPGPRVMQIAQRIADQLETVPLIELVELLEEPAAITARLRAKLAAERYPDLTTVHGQTSTPGSETR